MADQHQLRRSHQLQWQSPHLRSIDVRVGNARYTYRGVRRQHLLEACRPSQAGWLTSQAHHFSKGIKKTENFASIAQIGCGRVGASRKMDNIIEAKELQIERKHFYVELRENDRGKFLRITEEAHGRRNSIIVPSTGVDDFTAAISEVLTNNGSAPL
jgi:hypothetical protein